MTPLNWTRVPLDSLGSWTGGGTPSKDVPAFWTGGVVPWVSPKDMKVARVRDSEDHITEAAVEESATKFIAAGSVLIVTRSGILEHTLPVAVTEVRVTVNQDLKALSPHQGFDAAYIVWALRAFGGDILNWCKKDGTTVASIEFEALKRYGIPVAPTAEQARIVDSIETYLSRLAAAAASLERAQAKLKAYRASVLKAAVEGRLVTTEAELARKEKRDYESAQTLLDRILKAHRSRWEGAELARLQKAGKVPEDNRWRSKYQGPVPPDVSNLPELPNGWCWASVDQVGDVLLGRQRAPQYLTGKHARPYLRVANIKDDHIDFSDVETMDFDEDHFPKYRLLVGDILVSEGQSPHLVGQSAIYRGDIKGLCFQKTLHRFRSLPGGPSPGYAQVVFRANVKLGVYKALAPITTNIAHLTLEKFKRSRFPLSPVAEQSRIEAEVERLLSIADALAASLFAEVKRIGRLRQSILKWAFQGNLVDQDPADESADSLLARIQAERETAIPVKKPRRKKAKTAA